MNSTTRFIFVALVAAIVLAGLAAIALLWEHEDDGEGGSPRLGTIEKFTLRHDGVEAPEVSFEDGERRKLALAQFRGQVVLLNFWATWCAPCIRELPSLDRLQRRLEHKGVKVIALSLDRDPEAVKEFFADNGIHHLDVYFDATMAAQEAFKIPGLPTTVLIDPEGHDRGRLIGPADWSGNDAADLVLSAGTGH